MSPLLNVINAPWSLGADSKISKIILNKVAQFLIDNNEKNLQINGHADERGTEKYNMKLSKRRANSVYKYLIDQGVDKTRLSIKAFGESQNASSSHPPLFISPLFFKS